MECIWALLFFPRLVFPWSRLLSATEMLYDIWVSIESLWKSLSSLFWRDLRLTSQQFISKVSSLPLLRGCCWTRGFLLSKWIELYHQVKIQPELLHSAPPWIAAPTIHVLCSNHIYLPTKLMKFVAVLKREGLQRHKHWTRRAVESHMRSRRPLPAVSTMNRDLGPQHASWAKPRQILGTPQWREAFSTLQGI